MLRLAHPVVGNSGGLTGWPERFDWRTYGCVFCNLHDAKPAVIVQMGTRVKKWGAPLASPIEVPSHFELDGYDLRFNTETVERPIIWQWLAGE